MVLNLVQNTRNDCQVHPGITSTFCPKGVKFSGCRQCEPGHFFTQRNDSKNCQSFREGNYAEFPGAVKSCTPYPLGYYTHTTGSNTGCSKCYPEAIAASIGNVDCTPCLPGLRVDGFWNDALFCLWSGYEIGKFRMWHVSRRNNIYCNGHNMLHMFKPTQIPRVILHNVCVCQVNTTRDENGGTTCTPCSHRFSTKGMVTATSCQNDITTVTTQTIGGA